MKIFSKLIIFATLLCSFCLSGSAAELGGINEIKILSVPAKTTYYPGEAFEKDGLIAQAVYADGTTEILPEELYKISLPMGEIIGDNPSGTYSVAIISAENPSVLTRFSITVKNEAYEELLIKTPPARTEYYQGDTSLDLSGMEAALKLSSGAEVFVPTSKLQIDAASFNTDKPGKINLRLNYRGLGAAIALTVLENDPLGYAITTYPKSNYIVGEELDLSALKVGQTYISGGTEELAADLYNVSTDFDGAKEGTYSLDITFKDGESIAHKLTVREKPQLNWKTLRLGYFEDKAEERGGIGQYYDSLIFNYIEVPISDNFELSATLAANDLNGDFGLMLRDNISGTDQDTLATANLAAMGINNAALTLVSRTEESNVLVSQTVNENPTALEYSLKMSKTNSGLIFDFDNGGTVIFTPKEELELNGNTLYLGVYTSATAHIEVRDTEYSATAVVSDPQNPEVRETERKAAVKFISSPFVSENDQEISFVSDVNGTAIISVDDRNIAEIKVEANKIASAKGNFILGENNTVLVTIYPDAAESAFNSAPVVFNQLTEYKTFDGDIYASPNGRPTATGGYNDPLDVYTAFLHLKRGQQLYLYDGVYNLDKGMTIAASQSGSKSEPKKVSSAPNSSPVFDFGRRLLSKKTMDNNLLLEGGGFILNGDYWQISDVTFKNAADYGLTVGGNNNIIRGCEFIENEHGGLILREVLPYDKEITLWPANNLIMGSLSFGNGGNGFLSALKVGTGNVFNGCVANKNNGNGFETFMTKEIGKVGSITFDNCIAYENTENGFVLGGDSLEVSHTLSDCLAFYNSACGYAANTNRALSLKNCTAFENGINISLSELQENEADQISGFYSINKDGSAKDEINSAVLSVDNFFFNGEASVNKMNKELREDVLYSMNYRADALYYFELDYSLVRGPFLTRILK